MKLVIFLLILPHLSCHCRDHWPWILFEFIGRSQVIDGIRNKTITDPKVR